MTYDNLTSPKACRSRTARNSTSLFTNSCSMGIILCLLAIIVILIAVVWRLLGHLQDRLKKLDDRLMFCEAELANWHACWDSYTGADHWIDSCVMCVIVFSWLNPDVQICRSAEHICEFICGWFGMYRCTDLTIWRTDLLNGMLAEYRSAEWHASRVVSLSLFWVVIVFLNPCWNNVSCEPLQQSMVISLRSTATSSIDAFRSSINVCMASHPWMFAWWETCFWFVILYPANQTLTLDLSLAE